MIEKKVYLTTRNREYFDSINSEIKSECTKCGYNGDERHALSTYSIIVSVCSQCENEEFYEYKVLPKETQK